jgi:hypothetical protein
MSGFFGLRREAWLALAPLTSNGFELYLELVLKAQHQRMRIADVPVAFRHQRASGEFSILCDGPGQLARTLKLWRRLPR